MRLIQILALTAGLAGLALAGDKLGFKKEKEIALPGGSHFDYLTVFENRLYVAHGTTVDVVDLASGKTVGQVPGVDGAHGVVIVKEAGRGFATSGTKNKLVVFDLAKLTVTKEISVGKKPDAILWCATTKEVWTMNGKDGSISCVDPGSLEVKNTIAVGDKLKLESCVELASKGQVFVNVEQEPGLIVQIDAKDHKVLNKYTLDGNAPTGLALDEKNGVLFVGCEKKLLYIDAATGKSLGSQEIADGCDGVAFDPESGCAFASCGGGPTTVVREKDGKTFEVVAQLETGKGARTCTVDSTTHMVYIASSSEKEKSVLVLVFAPENK